MKANTSSISQNHFDPTKIIHKRKGVSGVYIHFPFCIQKCTYCDFYSIGSGKHPSQNEKNIFQSYKQELEQRLYENPNWKSYQFDTLFFGGGTPSRMDLSYLKDFIEFLRENLNFTQDFEMTLEANPEDVTRENVQAWQMLGFTRVNMGYQSSNQKHLEYVGRYYDPIQYKEAPRILAESNIPDIGYDLIYGFPNHTMEEFRYDLETLLSYHPTHISLYSLTMEKGTEYSRLVFDGIKLQPEEDLQIEVLEFLPEFMQEKGYEWYEVSNYCLSGHRSKHNLRYWMMEPYLALGPGAHGFDGVNRYANIRNLEKYSIHPTQAKLEIAQYQTELLLSLFRIFAPIEIPSFIKDQSQIYQYSVNIKLKEWANKNLASYENGIFQWKSQSVLYLDNYILELASAIEEFSSGALI